MLQAQVVELLTTAHQPMPFWPVLVAKRSEAAVTWQQRFAGMCREKGAFPSNIPQALHTTFDQRLQIRKEL